MDRTLRHGPHRIHIFDELAALHTKAADFFARWARQAVLRRGRFLAALSGGGTPTGLYEQLASSSYRDGLPWAQMHFFWGDERMVAPDDPGSNFRQANETLLKHVSIPEQNIWRIPGELPAETAAARYTQVLAEIAAPAGAWPRFDLALMGMGADGHTASLFPGPVSQVERSTPAMAVTAAYQGRPASRVTLTPMVFNSARQVLFLVTGAEKAQALQRVILGPANPEIWPAQRIQPEPGAIRWLVDSQAASLL